MDNQIQQSFTGRFNKSFFRRKSAQARMKGLIEKVLGHETKSKSCENLNVI
jgi:hypothetical protein